MKPVFKNTFCLIMPLLAFCINIALFSEEIFAQDIAINEVMGSNATNITDEDGSNEDWIEIYNFGEIPVNLEGYGFSDDSNDPFQWVFPEVMIQPEEYLLIWASGKNRTNPDKQLHTNFRINYKGEEVILTHPDDTRIDELIPTKIPTDISYGRKPDGTGPWFYFSNPTPGESNTTEGYENILNPPTFSKQGGFFKNEFELSITHPDPGVSIIYTLDGSKPCINNIDGTSYEYKNEYPIYPDSPMGEFLNHEFLSHEYNINDNINIKDRTNEENKLSNISSTVQEPYYSPDYPLFKGTVVRARTFQEGMLPSDIITNTYFVTPDSINRFNIPVISLSIQEDYLFEYNYGIYTPGKYADQWRLNNPNDTFSWPFAGNFYRRGDRWEHPGHIELFDDPGKRKVVDQQIGVRIHGGASRTFPMKSRRLYARNEYSNSHLNYAFFDSQPRQEYKRLILRNSGNDSPNELDYASIYETMFRDAAIQTIVKDLNITTQAYSPTILFINGEYWGIHNIRERYDKHFLNSVFGVDPDNIDLLTHNGFVKEGSRLHYSLTRNYIEENGLKEDENYQHILTRIDAENFIDYQISNIFASNTDWPGNNIDYWRLRTNEYVEGSKYGHDGRWRWLLFDTDFGFGLRGSRNTYDYNTLSFATKEGGSGWPNPDWSTFFLRSFLENDTFKNQFINRFADLLNTSFIPERTTSVINELKKQIAPEIDEHFTRWGYPDAYDTWENSVDNMIEFCEKRPRYQREHIKEFFDIEELNVKLNVSNSYKGYIKINTVEIKSSTTGVSEHPYPWEGRYFKNIPITIKAISKPGYEFSHWEGSSNSTSESIVLDNNKNINLTAHFNFKETKEPHLIHYWAFDTTLVNDTPLENLEASYSKIDGAKIEYRSCFKNYPYYSNHSNWRKASMERRNNPTPINYRPEGNQGINYSNVNMRGVQVTQPFINESKENEMIIHLPTYGFSDIVFRFAAINEDAADELIIDYNTNHKKDDWITSGLENSTLELGNEHNYYEINFGDIPEVNNNPNFKIRVRFNGKELSNDNGNRVTFNNISLDGIASKAYTIKTSATNNGNIIPSGNIPVYQGNDKNLLIIPNEDYEIYEFFVNSINMTTDLKSTDGDSASYKLSDISKNHDIYATFSIHSKHIKEHDGNVVIYPNPASDKITVVALENITRIDIASITGKILYSYKNLSSKKYDININNINEGFYIVIIYTENGFASKKMQVIR